MSSYANASSRCKALQQSITRKSRLCARFTCTICAKEKPFMVKVCINSPSHQMCINCVEHWMCLDPQHKFKCPFCRRRYEDTNHMEIIGRRGSVYGQCGKNTRTDQCACLIPDCTRHTKENSVVTCVRSSGRKRYTSCIASVCNPLHRLICPFRKTLTPCP